MEFPIKQIAINLSNTHKCNGSLFLSQLSNRCTTSFTCSSVALDWRVAAVRRFVVEDSEGLWMADREAGTLYPKLYSISSGVVPPPGVTSSVEDLPRPLPPLRLARAPPPTRCVSMFALLSGRFPRHSHEEV